MIHPSHAHLIRQQKSHAPRARNPANLAGFGLAGAQGVGAGRGGHGRGCAAAIFIRFRIQPKLGTKQPALNELKAFKITTGAVVPALALPRR